MKRTCACWIVFVCLTIHAFDFEVENTTETSKSPSPEPILADNPRPAPDQEIQITTGVEKEELNPGAPKNMSKRANTLLDDTQKNMKQIPTQEYSKTWLFGGFVCVAAIVTASLDRKYASRYVTDAHFD